MKKKIKKLQADIEALKLRIRITPAFAKSAKYNFKKELKQKQRELLYLKNLKKV